MVFEAGRLALRLWRMERENVLGRLREHGVRVAVDDVGSGFASFRHVTRVNPDILKLDRTLVCGIDDDPVRQSLAAASD